MFDPLEALVRDALADAIREGPSSSGPEYLGASPGACVDLAPGAGLESAMVDVVSGALAAQSRAASVTAHSAGEGPRLTADPPSVEGLGPVESYALPPWFSEGVSSLEGARKLGAHPAPTAGETLPGWLAASTDTRDCEWNGPPEGSKRPESLRSRVGTGWARPWSGVRDDFPILRQRVNGHPLVWLDNAATTQKPQVVIDAVSAFYAFDNSNVHRGAHSLAARATDAYEQARETVARFLGAHDASEIVFVRGATEGINLVAQSWGRAFVRAGDEILVTHLEHHANIVPWQQLCEATGAKLSVIPVDARGDVDVGAYAAMLNPRVRLVSMTHVSNALGSVVPVAMMAAMARASGARVLIDGAQSVAHIPLDMNSLGADFFVFSGHKIYGPTGIGALWARRERLEEMPPWQSGGSMIKDVTFERTIYSEPPAKFEAGTPHLAGAVGLGAALRYVEALGRSTIEAHEHALMHRMVEGLRAIRGVTILGEPSVRAGAVSFLLRDHSPSEVAAALDREGIAVRGGHHCAQPILRRFGHEASIRPSLGIYNEDSDIERLIEAVRALASSSKR